MPKYKEMDGKKGPQSILKKTMDDQNRKRKKPCIDPLSVKKAKVKNDQGPIETAKKEVKEKTPPVHCVLFSELNVLPDYEPDDTETPEQTTRPTVEREPFKTIQRDSRQASDSSEPERDMETMEYGRQDNIEQETDIMAYGGTRQESETVELSALQELEKAILGKDTENESMDTPHALEESRMEDDEQCESNEEVSEKREDKENEVPCEPKEKKYVEYYVNGYCLRNNLKDQYYARNQSGDELYWRDSVNAEVYAYKTIQVNDALHKIEYPALQNNEPKYIYDRAGKPRYPVDLTTQRVIFPKNPNTHEEIYLPDRKGNLFYPENKFGQQFYRKDAKGNEVILNNTYAQFADGSQIYPKKANEDQFYLKLGNLEVPAVKKVDNKYIPYYAEKKNGDQIYPREYEDSSNENDYPETE